MASLFLLSSILTLLVAFMGFCNADLIDDICAQSKIISPSRCTKTLRSDPRSHGADDLQTLGQIAIKKTKMAVRNTARVARSIRNRNNTDAVNSCIDTCSSSIRMLNLVSKLITMDLEGRRKGGLVMVVDTVAFEVDTCEDFWENGSVKGGRPAKLKRASRRAVGLTQVVRIIVENLL